MNETTENLEAPPGFEPGNEGFADGSAAATGGHPPENSGTSARPAGRARPGSAGTAGERRRGPKRRPLAERLWARVDKNGPIRPGMDTPCWVWTGTKSDDGYGSISEGGHCGKMRRTHRVAWELENGPIPEGADVCHRCDYPPCCRPDHLFPGTTSENMRDCATKGRLSVARFESKNRGERNGRAKLTRAAAEAIRGSPGTAAEVALRFGVSRYTVHAIRQGRIWRDAA